MPSVHFSKDVVQYGLAISRKLEIDFEIVSLGLDETEMPAGLHVHDLTQGDANTSFPTLVLRLLRLMLKRRHQVSVYIVFFWGAWAWIATFFSRFSAIGITINKLDGNPRRILNQVESNPLLPKYWIEKLAVHLHLMNVDLIACESRELLGAMKSTYPSALMDSKLKLIPNGVTAGFIDTCAELYPRANLDSTKLKVLFLGRVDEPFKGIEVFLKAIPFVAADNVNFIICGRRGAWSEELLGNFADKHPEVLSRMLVLDPVSGERSVAELLAGVDIICLPSFDTQEAVEGFPLVLLEAICSGVFFIASSTVPSAPDLLQNDFGEIFISGDSEDLARKIEQISQKPERLENVRANGLRETRVNFSWGALSERTLDLTGKSTNKT